MAELFNEDDLAKLPGHPPSADGEINIYRHPDVPASSHDNVIFINGMINSGNSHKASALALSLTRFATVTGVYNKTTNGWVDFWQCVGDKNQFNGLSLSAARTLEWAAATTVDQKKAIMRQVLSRNRAQVALFDLLCNDNRHEIFAHSQGNLILSNVLQALLAVRGSNALVRIKVCSFGSPAVNWPRGLVRSEMGYTFDPVSWLGGIDFSFSISKLGMPAGSVNPVSHGFLQYLSDDPAFIVNRFRVGGLGVTFSMDEEGLANCLIEMGKNTRRVIKVLDHLRLKHPSDSDDVALAYTNIVRKNKEMEAYILSLIHI